LRYLLQRDPAQIPSSLFRTGLKFLGYKLGLKEALFSPAIKRRLSMNHRFWQ
jgi:rhamnosyltransferase